MDGITRGGWKVVYKPERSELQKAVEEEDFEDDYAEDEDADDDEDVADDAGGEDARAAGRPALLPLLGELDDAALIAAWIRGVLARDGMGVSSGRRSMRGRTCWSPPTTTRSVGFRPEMMTRRPSSCRGPVSTRRYWALFWASTT